jgi:hypothetical protein
MFYLGPEIIDVLMTDNYSTPSDVPATQNSSPTVQDKRSGAFMPHRLAGAVLRNASAMVALLLLL